LFNNQYTKFTIHYFFIYFVTKITGEDKLTVSTRKKNCIGWHW